MGSKYNAIGPLIHHQLIVADKFHSRPNNVECSFASLKLLKGAFIQEIVIYSAHFVIKVTFLLFYLRLNQELAFRKWVFLGFALNGAVYLTNL